MAERPERVAVVTGGSRGLGAAVAEDLLGLGYRVAAFSRRSSPFVDARRAADPEEHAFLWRSLDGGDDAALGAFVREVVTRWGRLDVLVNNAGRGVDGLLATMRDDDIRAGIATNLELAIRLTRLCLKPMLRQRAGCVVNVSSTHGIRGHRGVSVYSATKAALDAFTRSLAREVGPEGIRVNSVAPGFFESDMTDALDGSLTARVVRRTPLGRIGTARDVAAAVRFLVSPEASFVTGHTLVVDGGLSC